ncbi:MAG: outer membrane beta-barrel protein [Burkholderiales bacterium]|nr:outer membrane beta-barrel protein [Burkholderiales bacterium]
MSNQAFRKSSSLKRLSLAALAACGVLASSVAMAEGFSGYAGIAGGFAPSQRQCHGATEGACDRLGFGSKLFGGWNVTPNVAAEINYFYFGGINTDYDIAQNATTSRVRESARAVTLGLNWSIELFSFATNNIRLGLARTQNNKELTNRVGAATMERDYATAPYLGLGLSMQLNRNVRVLSGYDYIIDGHDSRHLFSVGVQGEF